MANAYGYGMPKISDNDAGKPGPTSGGFKSLVDFIGEVTKAGKSNLSASPLLSDYVAKSTDGYRTYDDSDGGFLVPDKFLSELLRPLATQSPFFPRCRKISLEPGAVLKIPGVDETSRKDGFRRGGTVVDWIGEQEEYPMSKGKFYQVQLSLHKVGGTSKTTLEMRRGAAAISAGEWIIEELSQELSFRVNNAMLRGTGNGQPLGVLNADCLITVEPEDGQTAGSILYENILKMFSRFHGRSGVWFMHPSSLPQLATMALVHGTSGTPVYTPANGAADAPFGRLMGWPLIINEYSPSIGNKGDLLLADWSQYVCAVNNEGIESEESMHVRFLYDESIYKVRTFLDGQPLWKSAVEDFQGSGTVSPFVALAARD